MQAHHLKHVDKPNETSLLIDSCATALSMKQGEAELLRFYSRHSDGFAPSIAFIEEQTGLDKRSILRNRKLLEEDGIIAIDEHRIYIDWNRIRVFGFVGSAVFPKQRGRRHIAPVKIKGRTGYSDDFIMRTMTMSVEDLVNWLGSISDEENEMWKQEVTKKCHHNIYIKSF